MTPFLHIMAVQPSDAAVEAPGTTRGLLDEKTFLELYSRTAVQLRAYVIRTLGNATDADDIVQDSFLRLLRTPVPVGDEPAVRAYLFRVASNLVIDHYRARKREVPEPVPERAAAARDGVLRLDVGRFFRRLKARERQLLWLAHDAEREATAPIEVGDKVHAGLAILGAVALGVGGWSQLPSTSSPIIAAAVGVGGIVLVTVLTVAVIDALRGR